MKKAFSLIELIVVVVIIGIAASFAIPNYLKTREHALGKEASSNLKLIAAAERIYRMEQGTYYPPTSVPPESNINNINTNLRLLIVETNWDYSIQGGVNSFTAYADRNGSGGYLDCQYSLANDDADFEPECNSSCP